MHYAIIITILGGGMCFQLVSAKMQSQPMLMTLQRSGFVETGLKYTVPEGSRLMYTRSIFITILHMMLPLVDYFRCQCWKDHTTNQQHPAWSSHPWAVGSVCQWHLWDPARSIPLVHWYHQGILAQQQQAHKSWSVIYKGLWAKTGMNKKRLTHSR